MPINPSRGYQQHLALGLQTEAAEVSDHLVKAVKNGTFIDTDEFELELGDVLWYVTALASEFGITLEGLAESNLRKLHERHSANHSS